MELELDTTAAGDGVIRIVGRLTMVSAKQFTAAVDGRLADGTARVVVDLDRTTFMDSSGLGALVSALKRCRQAGGDLRIAAAPEQVLSVLRLTNLDRVLRPRDTVEGAFDVA